VINLEDVLGKRGKTWSVKKERCPLLGGVFIITTSGKMKEKLVLPLKKPGGSTIKLKKGL